MFGVWKDGKIKGNWIIFYVVRGRLCLLIERMKGRSNVWMSVVCIF